MFRNLVLLIFVLLTIIVSSIKPKIHKTILISENIVNNEITQEAQIDWAKWHSNVLNELITLAKTAPNNQPIDTLNHIEFDVDNERNIINIKIYSEPQQYSQQARKHFSSFVRKLEGSEVLNFPQGSQRKITHFNAILKKSNKHVEDLYDKEYDMTPGKLGTKIMWFSANSNGEAEVVKVTLKPKPRLKTLQFDVDFGELAIKGKQSQGNIVTKNEVHRFSLKEKGASTLGGREVWFDPDVLRINYDGRGNYLGEFSGNDQVLVILKNGEYYMSTFDQSNHYEDNILRIEKFRPGHVWTAVLNDADQGYPYIKRFTFEPTNKKQRFLGENENSTLIILSDAPGTRIEVTFGGGDAFRGTMEIDAMEFIAVKSYKAKGKRISNFEIASIVELEPREVENAEEEVENDAETAEDVEEIEPERSDDEVRDEINGQQRIF